MVNIGSLEVSMMPLMWRYGGWRSDIIQISGVVREVLHIIGEVSKC